MASSSELLHEGLHVQISKRPCAYECLASFVASESERSFCVSDRHQLVRDLRVHDLCVAGRAVVNSVGHVVFTELRGCYGVGLGPEVLEPHLEEALDLCSVGPASSEPGRGLEGPHSGAPGEAVRVDHDAREQGLCLELVYETLLREVLHQLGYEFARRRCVGLDVGYRRALLIRIFGQPVMVDYDLRVARVHYLCTLDERRSVGIDHYQERLRGDHAQSSVRLDYAVVLGVGDVIVYHVERFIVLFDNDVRILVEICAYGARAYSRSESIHVRPAVSHDEHLVGLHYEGFHGMRDDLGLAPVVFLK